MFIDLMTAARVLGIDTSDQAEDAIGRAARTLAVERYPLYREDALEPDPDDPGRRDVEPVPEEIEPSDGGTDGCPPAATRHVLAGAFVESLFSGGGFRYGDPVDPPGAAERLPTRLRPHYDYPDAPLYGAVERIVLAYLGVSDTRDPEPPSGERGEATTRAAIDLSIALFCDARPVAEIVAETIGTMCWEARSAPTGRIDTVFARIRRMCEVVAPRKHCSKL